jgi:perosamine synthetase
MKRLEVFNNAVTSSFHFLKETSHLEELYTRGIRLEKTDGMLLPVCRLQVGDENLIKTLANWRHDNLDAYPNRFPVTIEGTANWLSGKLLDVPDRILFLVKDRHGNDVGHLGFANCVNDDGMMEVDNVVRGVKNTAPGIMHDAMLAILKWAQTTLWPEGFYLRVLASNTHAIRFYNGLGFREVNRTALRRKVAGDVTSFDALAANDEQPPDDFFIRMELYEETGPQPGEKLILTAGPSISSREASYAYDAARYGWNNNWAKYLKEFESSFAKYVGVQHAIATSSCTGALHIALTALGIGPGDEVIVPDITWVATANAVLYVGATPIFADIDRNTWLLSPESIRSKITAKTKAIMPVHLYGHPCEMDQIMQIAKEHSLFVVEDAAPSIGAEYHGRRTGSFGHFACFSFQGAKLAVTGEGGMLVTSDDSLRERAYSIWDQGRKPGTFWIQSNGLKYKMSNVQAAIGLAQLQRNDSMVEAKRRIFEWYDEGLQAVRHLRLCREPEGTRSIYWMTSAVLEDSAPLKRDQLISALKQRNIDTRPVFPAISQYPIWPTKQTPLPNGKIVGDNAINLPSGVCLRKRDVEYVCRSLREILSAA